jgi:hypothetical protein
MGVKKFHGEHVIDLGRRLGDHTGYFFTQVPTCS